MGKRIIWEVILLISCVLVVSAYSSETWYVNNKVGNDAFDGKSSEPAGNGKGGPFATIQKAFNSVNTSDRIEVANTGKPYPADNTIHKAGGTVENPMVVDGHGATISGLDVVPKEKWKVVGENIVAAPFWSMSNGLKVDPKINWWIGVPQIWWLDGKPAPNCTSEEDLKKTEGGFFWHKQKEASEVWVHLPAGKTLSDVKIDIPIRGTAIMVMTSHVIVMNFRSILSWNDGFDTSGTGKHILFKNCIAMDNCGQGFSAHGWSSVTYEDCLAERCASAGIANVDYCQATYRRCVLINNTFDGGIGLYNHTQNTFEDCLIAGNTPFGQIRAANRASANFHNCVILGRPGEPNEILSFSYGMPDDGAALFWQCTMADASFLCEISKEGGSNLEIQNSIITRCQKPFLIIPEGALLRVTQAYNVYFDGPGIQYGTKLYGKDGLEEYLGIIAKLPWNWRKSQNLYWEDPGLEGLLKVTLPKDSPLHKKGRRYTTPMRIGAELPASVWDLYSRTRGEYGTPEGVKKTDRDLMAPLKNRVEEKQTKIGGGK